MDQVPAPWPEKSNGVDGEGLLTLWKISTHGKDGQENHHIVKIGMNLDGDRAPGLERLDEKILVMRQSSRSVEKWKMLATRKKARIQELLHRELNYSGVINDEMSYSATPLAVLGIGN